MLSPLPSFFLRTRPADGPRHPTQQPRDQRDVCGQGHSGARARLVLCASDGDVELGHAVPPRQSAFTSATVDSRRTLTFAALIAQTTTTERDFDVLAPPSVVDDEGKLLEDPLRLGNDEAPKELGYFRELCSLVAIKAKIIRSLYMVQKADCFPDSTVVLQIEELLVRRGRTLGAGS